MREGILDKVASFFQRASQTPTKDHVHCYCLGIDVVGYSQKTTDVQCQIVQQIQSIVERSNSFSQIHRRDVIFLPTGDGMIICLVGSDESPIVMISLAKEIQHQLRLQNNEKPVDEHIIVRIGLHSGTGASYSDINRKLNIAGTVANMTQRVTELGHDWHIIATKNAFDDIGTLDRTVLTYFHRIGFGEAKHKVLIEVYNVYCLVGEVFGNPVNPPGIQDAGAIVQTEP